MTVENSFQNLFYEKQNLSKKRLDYYIQEQGAKQIHDLRTSIRRLEAAYLVFPNSSKRRKTDRFVSSYKSLFQRNSPIRDLDVIVLKLLGHGLPKDSDIIKHTLIQKDKKIKNALKKAKKLSELKIPLLRAANAEKITQKYEKTVLLLVTRIHKKLQIVVDDESKVDELHSLRKTAKKLRYLLEIAPDGMYLHLVESMKLFQDLLGNIHDCDVAIIYLQKHSKKFPELTHLVLKEQKTRSQIYNKLASSPSVKKE